jgi:hypothetical protein
METPEMPTRDPFVEYVQRMQDRFANRTSSGSGPAKPSAGGQVLTEPGTADYLGAKTEGINLTGTSDTGDLLSGPGALPGPSTGAGAGGGFGGGPGQRVGPGGPDSFALAKSAIDAAIKSGKFAKGFFADPDLGTRGNVGGEGTTQRSDQSLSDQIRSTIDGAGMAPGTLGELYGPAFQTWMGNTSPTQYMQGLTLAGLSPAQANEVMSMMTQDPEMFQALGNLGGSGAAGAGSSLAGGLGLAGGGAAAAAAILGLIAQATGDPEIAKAAQAAGMGVGALGLGSTGASLASSLAPLLGTVTAAAPTGVAAGLGTGAATGLATGGAAGLGTAAGAAFAPVAAGMLAASIANMINPDSAPEISDLWTGGKSDPYQTFNQELAQNVGQQDTAFQTLAQALPYVQTQEELGQLINSYKNYLQSTTGIQLAEAADNPYQLAAIPGVGPVTHGQQTQSRDFGPQQQALQAKIDQLSGVLPGQRITALYGQPGGGLEGEANMRLWTQFLNREANAPYYDPGGPAVSYSSGGEGGTTDVAARPAGFSGIRQSPDALAYGQEGYNYAGSGFPEPGKYVGSISPYWQQIQAQQQAVAQERAQIAQRALGAAGGDSAFPGAFGPSGGFLSEDDRRRLGLR